MPSYEDRGTSNNIHGVHKTPKTHHEGKPKQPQCAPDPMLPDPRFASVLKPSELTAQEMVEAVSAFDSLEIVASLKAVVFESLIGHFVYFNHGQGNRAMA